MAMIGVSAAGFLVADGERTRVQYVRAMRRCLMRMHEIIRYEQPELVSLLKKVNLRATPQEKQLTQLLHACAERIENSANPQLLLLFDAQAKQINGFSVLSQEDRSAFEALLCELGRTGLHEQLQLISAADERLRQREEALRAECAIRMRLIRTLGVTGGAAAFLLLV